VGEGQVAVPRYSVVIPAYNEERLLPALLASLDTARERYGRGVSAVEIIVGDNASTDGTAALARAAGARVEPVTLRAIAAARNGGARAARGEVLCFIDADSVAHPDVFGAMDVVLADPRTGMGATGLRFERSSPGIAFCMKAMLPLAQALGIDGGLVFMRRADFEAAGGYDESLLVAEDVDLLLRVKRRCKATGRRFVRLQGVETVTSARKFDKHGDWHMALMAPRMAFQMLFLKERHESETRKYWYEDR